jgi:Flp pilus assembly protein TadG
MLNFKPRATPTQSRESRPMLQRFLRDRRGAAAVEFAFVAPLMILLYYGIAELTQGMMADRRTSHVASIIGDLVAQDTQVTQTEMDDIFNVGKAVVAPFPTATLSMRITSVRADASGTPRVVWSQRSGAASALPALGAGGAVTIPTGLIAANESVIMADATYVYTSSLGKVMTTPIAFTQKYYLKPRKGSEVLWSTS